MATRQSDSIDWDQIDTWVVAEGVTNAREVIDGETVVRILAEKPAESR